MNRNLFLAGIFIALWIFIIIAFLFHIQIIKYKFYYKQSMHIEKVKITPRRGTIFDKNGNIIAGSYKDWTGQVAIDSKNFEFSQENLKKIKEILNLSEIEMEKAINSKDGYYILKEKTPQEEIFKLENLKIEGLIIKKDYKRFYPYGDLLSHIVGWVDWKNDGISGLEYFFNDYLKGEEGEKLILRDSVRYGYDLGEEIKPTIFGKDIKTTLDISVQYIATKTLQNLKEKIDYEWGAITVINPYNGDILAHSINPPFDIEKKGKWQDEHLASSCYEPGSILKPFFADAALRLNLINDYAKYDCSKGYVEIADKKINDHYIFGVLNFRETLYFSSNVGCILWSLKIPSNEFLKTIEDYGFLKKTGVEVPSETKGKLNNRNINQLLKAYITLGQGISVTSAQILRAYSAMINGEFLINPHFTYNKIKKEKIKFKPEFEKLNTILFQTVAEGTGKKAYVSFIPMAGKTGTAQVAEGGKYIKGDYISSFVCWYPVDQPEKLILIVIKKPRPLYYGGDVAAPLAKDISFYLFLKGQGNENI